MDTSVLSEFLECSVCLETMDGTSKVLPCQHTFCKQCLDDIVEAHKELNCPECRLRVTTKVEDLPPNILLSRLIEELKKARLPSANAKDASPTGTQQQLGTPEKPKPDVRKAEIPVPAPSSNPVAMNVVGIPTPDSPANGSQTDTSPRQVHTVQRPCARALYSYLSVPPGQLSFNVGDMILLLNRRDDWFYGELNGSRGMFPKRYVKVLVPLPPSQAMPSLPLPVISAAAPQCVALYDFADEQSNETSGQNANKDKCLRFKAGEIITVLRRVDANWALGKLNGNIGIFPLPFVQLNQFARALLKHSSASSATSPPLSVPPTGTTNSLVGTQASTPNTDSPSPGPVRQVPFFNQRNPSIAQNQSPSVNGAVTAPPSPQLPLTLINGGNIARSRIAVCQRSPTANSSPAGPSSLPDVLRQLDPLLARNQSQSPPSLSSAASGQMNSPPRALNVGAQQPMQPQGTPAQPARTDSESRPNVVSPTSFFAQGPVTLVEAVYAYSPQKPDELELTKGDLYRVIEACQDHWFRGTHLKTGRTGVFPGNYVRPYRNAMHGGILQPTPSTTSLSAEPSASSSGATGNVAKTPSSSASATTTPSRSLQSRTTGLMKKLSTKRRSSATSVSPQSHSASTGNLLDDAESASSAQGVSPGAAGFEDSFVPHQGTSEGTGAPLHSRSGSCPSQLINVGTISSSRWSPAPLSVKLPQRTFSRSVSAATGPNRAPSADGGPQTAPVTSSTHGATRRPKTPPTGIVIDRYRCIAAYPAASPQELNLAFGDIVFVQRRNKVKANEGDSSASSNQADGWLKGRHATTGNVGYFPATFVQKV